MILKKRGKTDILLGFFVIAGILLLATLIFLIGKERRLFDSAGYLYARFPNVAGLSIGAQVLLGGVVVGHVSDIEFPGLKPQDPLAPQYLNVIMRVSTRMFPWIREDSVARIDSKGLLGDKTINISLGSPDAPNIKEGGTLSSVAPLDFNAALAQAQNVLEGITDSVESAKRLLEGFISEGGDTALAGAVKSFFGILKEIETGDGMVHQLIYDKSSGEHLKTMVVDVKTTVSRVSSSMTRFDEALKAVESNDSVLHALLYEPGGRDIVARLGNITKDLQSVMSEVRGGSGLMNSLIYSKGDTSFIESLNKAAADLKEMMSKLKSGQGTIGKLMVDSSIYDDLKLLLGNLERNVALKELVRYSITKKEKNLPRN